MKRYKLLKDLAGLKAGSTLYLNELGSLVAEDKTTIVFLANFIHHYSLLDSDWFEEIPEEYKRWRAKEGEWYWCVKSDGGVYDDCEIRIGIDDGRYGLGNYFKTEEEAQKAADWLRAFAILRDDTKGFKPDWEDAQQDKWYVCYNHAAKMLDCGGARMFQSECLYFPTQEDAEASIKNHKQEWLTFFNCGVEE